MLLPAGDAGTIDPSPVLANWKQLQAALHLQGAKASNVLLGATTSDVFLMTKGQLERSVLADPNITMDACDAKEVAAGRVDKRVLAVLAFLSRSGLAPTVSALRCSHGKNIRSGARPAQLEGNTVDVSAINGTAVARHQGPGTITDLTIRTLMTLPSGFVPRQIISHISYPQAGYTRAEGSYSKEIRLEFSSAAASTSLSRARTAGAGSIAPTPLVSRTSALSAAQWDKLMTRVAALPAPTVATEPSSAAVADPERP